MRRPRIYVSGPYTRGDTVLNIRRAILVAEALYGYGYAPLVPHLTAFHHLVAPHTWDAWLAIDLAWVAAAECVFRIPGRSKGATQETRLARQLGLPVFRTLEEAQRWIAPK